jgi:uncharacterized membrane protein
MNCPQCQQENPDGANYCRYCGAPLPEAEAAAGQETASGAAPGPGGTPSNGSIEAEVRELRNTVGSMASEVSRLALRVANLEQGRISPTVSRPAPPPPRPAPTSQPSSPAEAPAGTSPRQPASSPVSPARPAPGTPPSPGGPSQWLLGRGLSDKMEGRSWEWLLGGNWLARIGVLALVMGVGFFLKLAFDNDWIGETGRVALGVVAGLAFLGAGEYWRRHYPIWSQPLTGGGLAILYLSVFAAFSFYQLIPPLAALGLSFLITLTAAGLALRYESFTTAVLGIIGGFATPLFLSEHLPDPRVLLAYVLVLDLGVLALATFRNWRWFTLLGLLGSLVLFWFWLDRLTPDLLLAQAGLTAIFVIFMGATTLFHIIWRRTPGAMDQALMVINAAAYFGLSYWLLFDDFRPWMGGFTLLLALVYGLLAYAVLKRSREQVYLSLFALGIALVFLTIAVPVQLGGPWVSVAWAVEGAVLIWLSSVLRMNPLRWMGLVVFLVFAAWLLFLDTPTALRADLSPFFNAYAVAYGVAIGATYLAAYLLRRQQDSLQEWEAPLFPAFLVLGSLFLTIAIPVQVDGFWLPITWAIQGVVLTWVSFRLDLQPLRICALGVFAIMSVRLLFFETLAVDSRTFQPILNERFLAFGVGIVAAYLAGYFHLRWKDKYLDQREWVLGPAFLALANGLTLWLLSAEVITSVGSDFFAVPRGIAGNVTSLSLSILWGSYAALLMVLGIARRWRWVRLAGLALLAVPVAKLFLYDVFELDQGYRVAAFLSLGVILVSGGFLYQRFRGAIRGFLLE